MSETAPDANSTVSSGVSNGRSGAGRRNRRPVAVATAIDALQGFCLGADGRAAAASELRKLHLPADADHVDDLCQEVLIRVWARLDSDARADDHDFHAGVIPYARRCIHNAAVDLLRAGRTNRLDDVLMPRGRPSGETEASGADQLSTDLDDRAPLAWSDDVTDREYAPDVRWAVERLHVARPRLDPWVVSAALTTTHLADHPGLDLLPDIPVPNAQSSAAQAGSRWAGLAYAGRLDCWATPETSAVRERRSRALQRLGRLLHEAIGLARATGPTGGTDDVVDAAGSSPLPASEAATLPASEVADDRARPVSSTDPDSSGLTVEEASPDQATVTAEATDDRTRPMTGLDRRPDSTDDRTRPTTGLDR